MIFTSNENMTRHFIQYHVVRTDNPIPSEFGIRTRIPGDAKAGDVVWLLTGTPTASGTRYAFVFWFVVGEKSRLDDLTVLSGAEGEWISPPWAVSVTGDAWFARLLQSTLDNGAFGFRPVPPELLGRFEEVQQKSNPREAASSPQADMDLPDDVGPDDERQQRAILTRRGQGPFRAKLLASYGQRCAVTESRVLGLLEAAHITPHAEGSDYRVSNGILLRSDIHTLFDLNLIGIDPKLRVQLSEEIKFSEYGRYHGKHIERLPSLPSEQPSPSAIQKRLEIFLEKERTQGDQKH